MKTFKTYIKSVCKSMFWQTTTCYIDNYLGRGGLNLCKLHKLRRMIIKEHIWCYAKSSMKVKYVTASFINFDVVNDTVVHEYIHWILYSKVFTLVGLYTETAINICCKVSDKVSRNRRILINWMEFQANALTSILQMYRQMAMKKYRNYEKNRERTLYNTDVGVLDFDNSELCKNVQTGVFICIESHAVLNTPLFVTYDILDKQMLTPCERRYVEQCGIPHENIVKNLVGEYYKAEAFFYKDRKVTVDCSIVYHNGYENSTPEKQKKILQETIAEHYAIYTKLNQNYAESLKVCKKWRRVSNKEIAAICNINHETVGRCLKGKATSLNTIILICLALHLPPVISKKIIRDSPYNLLMSNTNHQWYDFILTYNYSKELDEIREFCTINNIEQL